MKNIFDFNHIDCSMNKEKLSEIKALYRFYHSAGVIKKLTNTLRESIYCLTCLPPLLL